MSFGRTENNEGAAGSAATEAPRSDLPYGGARLDGFGGAPAFATAPGPSSFAPAFGVPTQAKGDAAVAGRASPPPTGGGRPLDDEVRGDLEASFGADFGDVRVHEDGGAERLGAQAYTQGANIHFAAGQYQPGTDEGAALIGHELTHVQQQRAGVVTPQGKGAAIHTDPGLEAEADDAGARAAAGEPALVSAAAATPAVEPDDEQGESDEEAPLQAKLEWTPSKFRKATGTSKSFRSEEWKTIIRALEAYAELPDSLTTGIGSFDSVTVTRALTVIQGAGKAWLAKHAAARPTKQAKDARRATVVEEVTYRDAPRELGLVESGKHQGTTVKRLGGGQVSSVHLVDFGGQARIFKDAEAGYDDGDAPAAFDAGIPTGHNSLLNNRDVASSKLDALLETDVLARSDFATRTDEDGETKSGIAMEVAQGVSPQTTSAPDAFGDVQTFQRQIDYSNPELQRQLATLQLLDAITGQVDRHGGNFFVQFDGDRVRVKGIDNDLAFGKNKQSVAGEVSENDKYQGFPAYVDRAVAASVRRVTEDQLRATLSPLLPPPEVDATLVRFRQVLLFLRNLENMRPSHLLGPDEWNAHTAEAFDHTSYFGRAKAMVEQDDRRGRTLPYNPDQAPEERKVQEDAYIERYERLNRFLQSGGADLQGGRGAVYRAFGATTKEELAAAVSALIDEMIALYPDKAEHPFFASARARIAQLRTWAAEEQARQAEVAEVAPPQAEHVAPPTPQAEHVAPPPTEHVAPPTPQAEHVAPPTPQAEHVAPPPPQAEHVAPPTPQAEHVAPPTTEHVAPPTPQAEHVAPPPPPTVHVAPPPTVEARTDAQASTAPEVDQGEGHHRHDALEDDSFDDDSLDHDSFEDDSLEDEPDEANVLYLYRLCKCPWAKDWVTRALEGRSAITDEELDELEDALADALQFERDFAAMRASSRVAQLVRDWRSAQRRGVTDPVRLAEIDGTEADADLIREVTQEIEEEMGLRPRAHDVQRAFDGRGQDRQVRRLQEALRANATEPADAHANRAELTPAERASTGWALQGMRPEYQAKDRAGGEFRTRYMFDAGDDLKVRGEQELGHERSDDRDDQVLQFDGRLWRLADGMVADTRDAGELKLAVKVLEARLAGRRDQIVAQRKQLGEEPDPEALAELDARIARLEKKIARAGTHHSVNGQHIFVMNAAGQFFAGKGMAGVIHHSSFLAGGAVSAAGEVSIRDGRMVSISNNSGHYQPGPAYLWQAVKQLEVLNAPLDEIMVSVVGVSQRFRSARAFLEAMDPTTDASWFNPDEAVARLRVADKGAESLKARFAPRGRLARHGTVAAPRIWELGRPVRVAPVRNVEAQDSDEIAGDAEPAVDYPELDSPKMGYPEVGYPEVGYPEVGYPEVGYPEVGYPEQEATAGDEETGHSQASADEEEAGYPSGYISNGDPASGYVGLGYPDADTAGGTGDRAQGDQRGPVADPFAPRGHRLIRRGSEPRPTARRRRPVEPTTTAPPVDAAREHEEPSS